MDILVSKIMAFIHVLNKIVIILVISCLFVSADTNSTTSTTGTTGTTSTTGGIVTNGTTGNDGGGDNQPLWKELSDISIRNFVIFGVLFLFLLCIIYACTCFDKRKPLIKYEDITLKDGESWVKHD